jgi:2',3'-cyclic-nucleotide 2'-phosphodiesterase (5'-nucleotidase family)
MRATSSALGQVTLIQINDTHAYLDLHPELFWAAGRTVIRPAGGFARLATVAKGIRQDAGDDNCLLLDCGDTLHGTYPAVATAGQVMVPVLNQMGIAAMTPHWEFAYGPAEFMARANELAYPVLAANIFESASGNRPFAAKLVREAGGLRIGIIGLACNIVDKTMPPHFSQGLRFTLGNNELPALIHQLRHQDHVDVLVLLSHLGFAQDVKLVQEVPGIDVCLSGHTHNRLDRPFRAGNTLIIQSGCHGSFMGRLDLRVEAGRIVDHQHQLIVVDADVPPDVDVAALVRDGLAPFADQLSEVVGHTATALDRGTILESTLDNLLLQALLEHTGAELAFSNGWRYCAPVPPGPVTLNDLHNMVPVDPPVSMVALTGQELLLMLEENLELAFAPDPYDQMGGYVKRSLGLKAYVKLENPAGGRIQALFVGDEPVDRDRIYSATFITNQGVPAKYGSDRRNLPERTVPVMRDYLRRHNPAASPLRDTFTLV